MDPKPKVSGEKKEKKKKQKKQRSPQAKFVFTVLKILAIFFVALICAVIGIVGGAIYGYIKTTPIITDEQLQITKMNSIVYDRDNKEITQLHQGENRIWAYYDEIPKNLVNAFVAIEDERFWEHSGVDIKRAISSMISVFTGSKMQGGSTITMQLVRNLTNQTQVTLKRKIQEQWSAIQLEKRLEKWQILELYLNVINTGHGCSGVQAAAKTYFNKDVKDLDLAECASIAGITNLPGYYDPLSKYGTEPNKKRQEIILKKMSELTDPKTGQKMISQEQYQQALNENLKFNQGNAKELSNNSAQPYFVDQVVLDVKRDLMAKGISEQIALKTIYNNGLKIYTTMDSNVQKAMDEVYNDPSFFPALPSVKDLPQSGMVLIDPKTGQVRAMYGGNGKKTGNSMNMATQAFRPVGSSFKPLAVYGPAIDQKIITAGTVVDDVPMHLNGANKASLYPQNFTRDFKGLTTIRDAIANSVNTVAAQVYMMNPDACFPYLKKVGIQTDQRNISLALGGLNNGLSPLQMASAYTPFANKGMYTQPTTYTKVVDSKGNVILEKKPNNTIVYSQPTAYIMTSMMQSVVNYGTAYPNGIIKNGKGQIIPTAGKTGTTSEDKDRWFVGYSPYYVGAVWYGYKTPTDLEGINSLPGWNGINPSLKIWNAVMTKIHKNLDPVDFPQSPDIVTKTICVYSGKLPGPLCEKDPREISKVKGSLKYNELFIKGTEPKETCDVHVEAKVSKNAKAADGRYLLAGPNTPVDAIINQIFVHRKKEYKPMFPNDPTVKDWIYELPAGEYDNVSTPTQQPPTTQNENGTATDDKNKDDKTDNGQNKNPDLPAGQN